MSPTSPTPVCDYEESDYRTRFWQGQGRTYEDLVERIALRRLMPPTGKRLIDIGAGYGRLADEFSGYETVVLFDYSRSLLREAQQKVGDDPRFIFVAGNGYQMPFVGGLFESLVQVRTIHHAADAPLLFEQLARIARPGGRYVLEFANKHNVKAIARYWLGRQRWSPFQLQPIEFVKLNFDFHPRWMNLQLEAAGFIPGRRLTVSHFRLPLFKRLVPARLLAFHDSLLQWSGNWWQLTPSVFVACQVPASGELAPADTFFACPACGTALEAPVDGLLTCRNSACECRWPIIDGLYDFKEPV